MNGQSIFIHSEELDNNGFPPPCPFDTSRAGKTREIIRSLGLISDTDTMEITPEPVSREELELFHTPEYLDMIKDSENGNITLTAQDMGIGSMDCPVFPDMYNYFSLACGGTVTGARYLLDNKAKIVFNPSGGFHHAGPSTASGFCYLNDIAIASKILLNEGKRILFLDLDVHHCNGVQDEFYDNPDIMTVSMHQSGKTLFPGTGDVRETGKGKGKGYTANIPLPEETYNSLYYRIFKEGVLPLIERFSPDIIIFELGMDTLAGDPLAQLKLTNNIYIDIIRDILKFKKPLLATGGGGYNIYNTVRSWALVWSLLSNQYEENISMGLGGVMLENTNFLEGLIDRSRNPVKHRLEKTEEAALKTLEEFKQEFSL
ncbi:MAG: acetoin utilization protein AcuC [Chitinivibrionales bacterium]